MKNILFLLFMSSSTIAYAQPPHINIKNIKNPADTRNDVATGVVFPGYSYRFCNAF